MNRTVKDNTCRIFECEAKIKELEVAKKKLEEEVKYEIAIGYFMISNYIIFQKGINALSLMVYGLM